MKNDMIPLPNIPERQSYEDYRREVEAEQAGLSREEVASQMQAQSEAVFDPETAVAPKHNWVDRGMVMSCEGAGHPSHRHFKVKRGRIGAPR